MKTKRPIIIGLTGGMGMGKSTASRMLRDCGAALFDADACVADALANGGAAEKAVAQAFPESVVHGRIDKKKLYIAAFSNKRKIKKLEDILHPIVWKERDALVNVSKRQGIRAVVLDIPLLFETGTEAVCDKTICVFTDAKTQKERVLKRKNMTPAKLRAINKQQWPVAKKRMLADVSLDMRLSKKQARDIIKNLFNAWCGDTKTCVK